MVLACESVSVQDRVVCGVRNFSFGDCVDHSYSEGFFPESTREIPILGNVVGGSLYASASLYFTRLVVRLSALAAFLPLDPGLDLVRVRDNGRVSEEVVLQVGAVLG